MCNITVSPTIVSGLVVLVTAIVSGATGFVVASLLIGMRRSPPNDGWLGRLRESHHELIR